MITAFLTICVKNRRCVLGRVVGADVLIGPQVQLTHKGQAVRDVLVQMPQVDKFVVMPNHIHMIACL